MSLLGAEEQQRIVERKSRQHLQDCLADLRCNEALLREEEQRSQLTAARPGAAR
jgi:hypothetical protein